VRFLDRCPAGRFDLSPYDPTLSVDRCLDDERLGGSLTVLECSEIQDSSPGGYLSNEIRSFDNPRHLHHSHLALPQQHFPLSHQPTDS